MWIEEQLSVCKFLILADYLTQRFGPQTMFLVYLQLAGLGRLESFFVLALKIFNLVEPASPGDGLLSSTPFSIDDFGDSTLGSILRFSHNERNAKS